MSDRVLEKMLDDLEQFVADRTAVSLRPSSVERQDRANRLASAAREMLTARMASIVEEAREAGHAEGFASADSAIIFRASDDPK